MLKNFKDEVVSDAADLWISVCETKHPTLWGFIVGYAGWSSVIYTLACVLIIILSKKCKVEEDM